MANVQTENGYTKIANEILEALAKIPLNGTQWRIISVVWRYTYGFSRKEHEISLSFMSKALECPKKQVQREINKLIDYKILVIEKEAGFNSSRCLSFNKDYTEYKIDYSSLIRLQGISETMEQSPNQTTEQGANQTTKKTKNKIKPNSDTEKSLLGFEQFYSQYPHPTERQRTLRNWNTALKHNTAEELLQAAKNYAESAKGREKQFIKTSSNFLGREKPYLDYIRVPQSSEPLKRREIIVEEIERE